MTEETFMCSVCGQSHPMHECTTFEDEELCPLCLDAETRVCHVCGERIWQDDNAGDGDTPLCEHCYELLAAECRPGNPQLLLQARPHFSMGMGSVIWA